MDLVSAYFWPLVMPLIVWTGGCIAAWSLYRTARTGTAQFTVHGPAFRRETEPFEFWFLTGINLIIVPGMVWLALDSGVSPPVYAATLQSLWLELSA